MLKCSPMPFVPLPVMPGEVWADVHGYAGRYWISTYGRVISRRGLMKPTPRNKFGHLSVVLYSGSHSTRVTHSIHNMVLRAFVGPPPPGLVACHNDGNAANSRLDNLRYDTQSSNIQDSVNQGTQRNTRKTHCKRGHEFTPENTYLLPKGGRQCRACMNLRQKATRAGKSVLDYD